MVADDAHAALLIVLANPILHESLASSYHLVANLLPGVHRAVSIGVRKEWNPEEVWQEMDERAVTYFAGNPLVLSDLLNESRRRNCKPRGLTRCLSGGAPLPPVVKLAYYHEFGVHVIESYGQSELGGFLALGYSRAEPGKRFFKHPSVHYSGVIPKPDPDCGQIALGLVELYPGQIVSETELMVHCLQILGSEDSPQIVKIIEKMPMTPTGKIGKQELIRLYGQ